MQNNPLPSGELILEKLGINPHNLPTQFPTREQRLQYRAVVQWLTDYQPKWDASNLEKVRGYLEAFYHLCELEDWERAWKILLTRLNTPTKEQLHNHLNTWGYYHEQADIYDRLLKKINEQFKNHNIGYRQLEGTALGNMGNIYYDRGDFLKALEYHEQHLAITEEIGDLHGKANAMEGLSNVSFSQGNHAQSIDYRQQQLTIAKQIGDRKGEGNAFGGLGMAYCCQGEYDQAIASHQQHLVIAEEIGDLKGQATALCNLGCGLFQLEQYSDAELYFCRALKISQEIGDRSGEAYAFRNLVSVYKKLGNSLLALESCDRALSIATELGIPLAKECQELKEKLLLDRA